MSFTDILIFTAAALLFRLASGGWGRRWLIFAASLLAVFWLQPSTPIRYLDFWLPLISCLLAVFVWWIVTPAGQRANRQNWIAFGAILLLALAISLSRRIVYEGLLVSARPPGIDLVMGVFLVLAILMGILTRILKNRQHWLNLGLGLILLLFVCLKVPWIAEQISSALRLMMQQPTAQAAASDLRWLGYSYFAFRLLHVIRDHQRGRKIDVSLRDFFSYALFFPALTSGPIDRLERFQSDLDRSVDRSAEDFGTGGRRLAIGLLKKFVLADTLAIIALNPFNAAHVQPGGWSWLMLYAYSFQIYLDFSGYTDIAIGVGQLLGIKLPENFNRPYLQSSLSTFWNNWHMTLTNWFRAYFFNPITRSLRRSGRLRPSAILLLTQLGTMILIGLWHGFSVNYLFWGIWHGLGLFIQNRWSDWSRPAMQRLDSRPRLKSLITGLNVLLTFHYVTLGWVWFALPETTQSISFLGKILGSGQG